MLSRDAQKLIDAATAELEFSEMEQWLFIARARQLSNGLTVTGADMLASLYERHQSPLTGQWSPNLTIQMMPQKLA
jgi:hypothetical protein